MNRRARMMPMTNRINWPESRSTLLQITALTTLCLMLMARAIFGANLFSELPVRTAEPVLFFLTVSTGLQRPVGKTSDCQVRLLQVCETASLHFHFHVP